MLLCEWCLDGTVWILKKQFLIIHSIPKKGEWTDMRKPEVQECCPMGSHKTKAVHYMHSAGLQNRVHVKKACKAVDFWFDNCNPSVDRHNALPLQFLLNAQHYIYMTLNSIEKQSVLWTFS
jgi:hypothetical protein